MDLAGKTNAAFVFIKPHACNEKVIYFLTSNLASAKGLFRITNSMHEQVKTLVREHFKARGIRVTGTWHACMRACWLRACMRWMYVLTYRAFRSTLGFVLYGTAEGTRDVETMHKNL